MTALHDGRATTQRSKRRLDRPVPDSAAAAEPPPPKRAATRVARSPSPPRRERGSEEDATAARRAEAPVPPPNPDASARTAYVLRSRLVPDTSSREPCDVPPRSLKREEPKHDQPRSSRKKLKQEEPWEAPACAHAGLEHYNSANQGDEHELVKAVGVHSFTCCGGWLHTNFLARRKGANTCADHVPMYFFAELKLDGFGLHCASCVKIESVESRNLGVCGVCPERIMHPATGAYLGAQPRCIQPAEIGLEISISF